MNYYATLGPHYVCFLIAEVFGNQKYNIQKIFKINKGKMSLFEKFHFEIKMLSY